MDARNIGSPLASADSSTERDFDGRLAYPSRSRQSRAVEIAPRPCILRRAAQAARIEDMAALARPDRSTGAAARAPDTTACAPGWPRRERSSRSTRSNDRAAVPPAPTPPTRRASSPVPPFARRPRRRPAPATIGRRRRPCAASCAARSTATATACRSASRRSAGPSPRARVDDGATCASRCGRPDTRISHRPAR